MSSIAHARKLVTMTAWALCALWLGCNALLGNESAVFDPDASVSSSSSGTSGGPDGSSSSGEDALADDGAIPDGSNPDAGPCVDKTTNPRHCGACFHDCINGSCVDGACQPFLIAKDLGEPRALAVSATHAYWTTTKSNDLKRAPIGGGGASEIVFNGSPDAGLGTDIAVRQGYVYFAHNPGTADGGIARCPETGCGANPAEMVVAHIDFPSTLAFVDNSIVFAETGFGARVGRCTTPPCLNADFTILGPSEKFPLKVGGAKDVVTWSTLSPSEVRVSIGGGAPFKATSANAVYPVAVIGNEIVYADLAGPIRAVPIDGGTSRTATAVSSQTDYFAVEGTVLYYADTGSTGNVYRLDLATAGGADGGTILAKKQTRPRSIATDATSIYWVNEDDDAIMRLAK